VALIKGKVAETSQLGNTDEQIARLAPDGSIVTKDSFQAMIDEGRAFAFNVGTLVTKATGSGVGTVLDPNQPDFMVSVPTGTSIWTKSVRISAFQLSPIGTGDVIDVLVGIDRDEAINAGTPGTGTDETVVNLNTKSSKTTSCTVKSQFTVDTGSATLDLELAHVTRTAVEYTVGSGTGILQGQNSEGIDMVYEPLKPVKIVGPGKLLGYWGGTNVVFAYAQVEWYELTA